MSVPWSSWPPVNDAGVLVTSDQVTNLSAVAGATVTVALDSLESEFFTANAAIAALALAVGTYPYIAVPSSPNSFDDEFDSGSPDLATRGYTVVNATTGVVQTRSGDIAPLGAAPAAGTYFSTIIGSWLYIQAPAGIQLDVYKAIALAAGETYFARTCGSFNLATAVNGRFCECGLFGAAGAQLDNNNRVYCTVRDDTTANYLIFDAARVTGGALVGAAGRTASGGHDIRGIYVPSATNAMAFYLDSQNGEPSSVSLAGTPALATLTRFALRNLFSVSGSAVPQIWGIDFIRRKTANAWLIP
jgi:hypothetical protein